MRPAPPQGGAHGTQINGWRVLMVPDFVARYTALRDEARRLRGALSASEYCQHPTVKLAAAVQRLVTQIVPQDPNHRDFMLTATLKRFRRAKGRGLPPRYRLFWIFSQKQRIIIFLYLNDESTLRQEGSRKDPYAVFAELVRRGEIGADLAANHALWERALRRSPGS